jgi:ABC-type proline/glycine betaine transport system permease subunit
MNLADPVFLIVLGILNLIALLDIWASRLSQGAKLLWSILVLAMVGVGLGAWVLTRHTAHQPLPEIPEPPQAGGSTGPGEPEMA